MLAGSRGTTLLLLLQTQYPTESTVTEMFVCRSCYNQITLPLIWDVTNPYAAVHHLRMPSRHMAVATPGMAPGQHAARTGENDNAPARRPTSVPPSAERLAIARGRTYAQPLFQPPKNTLPRAFEPRCSVR